MTKQEIDILCSEGKFPEHTGSPELVETHISWVVLCDRFVYKIKRPVCYSFLDFSTLEKRKYYCEREIELNRRLTEGIYLDVQPIKIASGIYFIGDGGGEIIDYAVRMHKVDRSRQMDQLLLNNKVKPHDIQRLAKKIAAFHSSAIPVYQKDLMDIQIKFKDLEGEKEFLKQYLDNSFQIIENAVRRTDRFMRKNKMHLAARQKDGFTRDCHGDLHSRNIFLLAEPQPFDCIEFNDDYRQIDVLNEIAFLCMDLDAFNKQEFSELFLNSYNSFFYCLKTEQDRYLFTYYKCYRANIRAKVNSLRARSAGDMTGRHQFLAETEKYLTLMNHYIKLLG